MSQFTKALVVTPLADGRTWVLLEPFSYDVGREGSGDRVRVPVKFMTVLGVNVVTRALTRSPGRLTVPSPVSCEARRKLTAIATHRRRQQWHAKAT